MGIPLPIVHTSIRASRKYTVIRTPVLHKHICSHCKKDLSIRGSKEDQRAQVLCQDCYISITE